jgi:hypothetical protein
MPLLVVIERLIQRVRVTDMILRAAIRFYLLKGGFFSRFGVTGFSLDQTMNISPVLPALNAA